jgi:carboxymethylenebutenolidase
MVDSMSESTREFLSTRQRYTICMYGNVNHAFHNDTNATRYDADAAKLSWERTMAFFDHYLKD